MVFIVGCRFPQGGLDDLLVELGQLPAQTHRPVGPERRRQVLQRAPQLVGRFIEQYGPGLPLQSSQPLPPLPLGHRQKSLKDEPRRGLPAGRQRRDAGRCPRHRHHPDPPGMGFGYDLLAGIADAGHPRVTAQGAVFPRLDALQDRLAVVQGVLIVTHQRLFQPQMVQQPQRHAGILGGHKIHRPERGRHPRRHVVQIADGRRHQIQCPGQNKAPFVSIIFYYIEPGHRWQGSRRDLRK